MGWGSAGYRIFDPVAQALIEADASDDLIRKTLGALIDELQQADWDTELDSLDGFRDEPIIVEIFREKGVTTECLDSMGPEHADECTRLLGHEGDHRDDQDTSWPPVGREA